VNVFWMNTTWMEAKSILCLSQPIQSIMIKLFNYLETRNCHFFKFKIWGAQWSLYTSYLCTLYVYLMEAKQCYFNRLKLECQGTSKTTLSYWDHTFWWLKIFQEELITYNVLWITDHGSCKWEYNHTYTLSQWLE
jgi:hypothetical protein